MWAGELHDRAFIDAVLDHTGSAGANYATEARIIGMLTIARHVSAFCY